MSNEKKKVTRFGNTTVTGNVKVDEVNVTGMSFDSFDDAKEYAKNRKELERHSSNKELNNIYKDYTH